MYRAGPMHNTYITVLHICLVILPILSKYVCVYLIYHNLTIIEQFYRQKSDILFCNHTFPYSLENHFSIIHVSIKHPVCTFGRMHRIWDLCNQQVHAF